MSLSNSTDMRQLALDLKLADFALFDTFYPGSNTAVLDAVRRSATEPGQQVMWVWGADGSGRSHLLQAAVAAASAGATCAWLPLGAGEQGGGERGTDEDLSPGMLEGMGVLDLLCVDDVDAIAGDADWERALFGVFEDLRNNDGCLIVTASAPANDVAFGLPDLQSRLASGPTWRLRAMDDDDLLAALQLRSHWRGLDLPDETGQFLLRRVERSTKALFSLLDELDQAALTAQRRLTVPFVRSVLDAA
jgi:DnaA-homolog protein